MEGSPKFWDSLSAFLEVELKAYLTPEGRIHLTYPPYYVEKSYTSKVSYKKEWSISGVLVDFIMSAEGHNLLDSLGYKGFKIDQII
jgi:hypothetical protein